MRKRDTGKDRKKGRHRERQTQTHTERQRGQTETKVVRRTGRWGRRVWGQKEKYTHTHTEY